MAFARKFFKKQYVILFYGTKIKLCFAFNYESSVLQNNCLQVTRYFVKFHKHTDANN